MKPRFTARAIRQLRGIEEYIRERNPSAARSVGHRIRRTTELLAKFPTLGHAGALERTREIVVPGLPYIIVHRIGPDGTLIVLASGMARNGDPDRRQPKGHDACFRSGVTFSAARCSPMARAMKRAVIGVPS